MAQQHTRPPFSSYAPTQSQVTYAGPMSYSPGMHGAMSGFPSSMPFPSPLADPATLPPDPTYYDISVATHKQIASLQAKLDQKLGPEYISQRPGPGGGPKLTYAEGWKIINLANEVFGFNGWSSSICGLTVDYIDPHDEGRRWNCGVSAVVRVTLRDGVYHEDVGYGTAENIKNKGAALDKCKKEAVTDAIKRTLRNFGNLLGNCLYDKQYTQEVVKIKVQPPKFDRGALHRRPEFEQGASGGGGSKAGTTSRSTTPAVAGNGSMPPPPVPQHAGKADPPVHVKSEPAASGPHTNAQRSHHNSIPNAQPPAQRAVPAPAPRSATTPAPVPPVPPINEPSVDPDEASYFNSDDDALLMQLDIEGAGSMILEEDRPIEYEDEADEDISGMSANPDESGLSGGQGSAAARPAPATNAHSGRGPAHAQAVPQNQNRHQPRAPAQPNPQAGQRMPQQQPQQHRPSPNQPQQHRPSPNQPQQHRPPHQPNHNQQHRPPQQPSAAAHAPSATTSHPSTPSMGSFHFPPGVDPSTRPPNHLSGPSAAAGSEPPPVAGIKRGADAMSSRGRASTSHPNHGHPPNNGGRPRAPLAPLAISEGGDVKRMKR